MCEKQFVYHEEEIEIRIQSIMAEIDKFKEFVFRILNLRDKNKIKKLYAIESKLKLVKSNKATDKKIKRMNVDDENRYNRNYRINHYD